MRRHITIDVPAPCDFINSNMRLHRMAQAKLTKAWREAKSRVNPGKIADAWDNRNGPGGACNTTRSLTR